MNSSDDSNSSSEVDNYLNLLSTFHYVVAGITGLFSLFPLIHVFMGFAVVTGKFAGESGEAPPVLFGWFFVVIGLAFIIMGLTLAVLMALAGRYLSTRRYHTFCLVVAGISCLWFPFGTVLGVFTIIVLLKDEAKQKFH